MTLFLTADRGSNWHPLPVANAPCVRIGEIKKKSLMNIKALRKEDIEEVTLMHKGFKKRRYRRSDADATKRAQHA